MISPQPGWLVAYAIILSCSDASSGFPTDQKRGYIDIPGVILVSQINAE